MLPKYRIQKTSLGVGSVLLGWAVLASPQVSAETVITEGEAVVAEAAATEEVSVLPSETVDSVVETPEVETPEVETPEVETEEIETPVLYAAAGESEPIVDATEENNPVEDTGEETPALRRDQQPDMTTLPEDHPWNDPKYGQPGLETNLPGKEGILGIIPQDEDSHRLTGDRFTVDNFSFDYVPQKDGVESHPSYVKTNNRIRLTYQKTTLGMTLSMVNRG